MTKPIQLLLPMSGQGVRFQRAGYKDPKPLIPVNGTPMIQRLLRQFPNDWPTTFVLADNHANTELPNLLNKLRPNATLLFVKAHQLGPGHAIQSALAKLQADAPVLVSYCDYGMVWDADQFERFVRDSACDACLVSYRGFHAHYLGPMTYAYSRMQGERVTEVKEKGSFTSDREQEFASCGAYYFGTANILADALSYQIETKLNHNGEYYTSLTTQALLQKNPNAHVRVFEIPGFFQWGTPEDLQIFEYWEKTFQSYNRNVGKRAQVSQVLMPMAGFGSRFAKLTDVPKPLLQINDSPMFEAALASLPQAKQSTLVTTEAITKAYPNSFAKHNVVALAETPPGQAITTRLGAERSLNDSGDVLVSSCDHAITYDRDLFAKTLNAETKSCDAAIFCIKGFPGTQRRPTAFAYVAAHNDGHALPLVDKVSVKTALSETPQQDWLLVGTFWFRSKAILLEGIAALEANATKVNGEYYLDSVFTFLLQNGYKVRVFPLEGYINWGDPDSLAEAQYWEEIFTGKRSDRRPRIAAATLQGNAYG